MASCFTRIKRLTKGVSSYVIVGFLLFNMCLMIWTSIPCPVWRSEETSQENFHHIEVKSTTIQQKQLKQPFSYKLREPDTHQNKLYDHHGNNISESDIISLTPTKLNLQKYRQLLEWKKSELKKNGVLKLLKTSEPCDWGKPGGPCMDKGCKTPLPPALHDDNLASVMKPLSRLKHSALSKVRDLFGSVPRGHRITFLTASSSNHFLESQALLKNLHEVVFPKLTNYTLYFYDIGLKDAERKQLKKWCKCEIRSYPLKQLPERFAFLRGFTWKPLIINAHLSSTDFVVWVDASIRFVTSSLEPMFQDAKSRGLVIAPGGKFSVGEHTSRTMFNYYGDVPCQYSQYEQEEASFQVIYNDQFTRELFLPAWAGCALDPLCMCSHHDVKQFSCNWRIRKYSKCDRTDQAAHTLLLIKLFRENVTSFYIPKGKYHVIRRHMTAKYFEELESRSHGR